MFETAQIYFIGLQAVCGTQLVIDACELQSHGNLGA